MVMANNYIVAPKKYVHIIPRSQIQFEVAFTPWQQL